MLQLLCEIFTPALAGSRESEWQQVSTGLQDSFQYSSRSHQCCNLDSLNSSSEFLSFTSLFQTFGNCSKCTYYNRYHRHPHVPQLFFSFLVFYPELFYIICQSKSLRTLWVSFSKTDSDLVVWSKLDFLHNSQWIPLPNQSNLLLHSFCANSLHSITMR